MQTTTAELGKLKQIKYISRGLYGTILASVSFVLSFTFVPVIIASASATTVGSNVQWTSVDIEFDPDVEATEGGESPSLPTHGNIDFGDITPSAKNAGNGQYGTMVIERKRLGITSNSGKYYTVYLSMTDTVQTGEGTTVANNGKLNLQENGYSVVSSTLGIPATTGTWDTPKTAAINNANGWGYMVPETSIKKTDGTTTHAWTATTQSYAENALFKDQLDTALTSTGTSTAYANATWAGVPAYANAQQIWKKASVSGFSTQDTFDVYYGVIVDSDVMSGTYQNSVVYSVLASAESLDEVSTHLSVDTEFVASGTLETLTFDIAGMNWANLVDENDISIAVVPYGTIGSDAELATASTTLDAKLGTLDFSDYPSCTVKPNSLTISEYAMIECYMPTASKNGTITVADSTTSWTGSYDLWLRVSGYNYNFVTRGGTGGNKPAIAYAGLQSTDGNGNKYVTKMQEMTAGVCASTNKWGNALGSQATLADVWGTDITSQATLGTWNEGHTVFTPSTTSDGVGTFALKDTRDGKRYVVRRLADGQCWMVQNLNLDLYTGMTFTNEDTNLKTRTSWTLADAEASNDERTMSPTANYGDLAWVADAGSTSRAWQIGHKVGTVTLKKYTYDGMNWNESIIAKCEGGTAQTPCFATKTTESYYRPDGSSVSQAQAADDGYKIGNTGSGSLLRGFDNGAYYVRVTYQVRQVNANASGSWSTRNVGPGNATDSAATCSFNYYWNHLQSGEACVIETEGDTLLTQFSNNTSSIGLNTIDMTKMNISLDHQGTYTPPTTTTSGATYTGANTIDFMNNTTSAVRVRDWFDRDWYTISSLTTWPTHGSSTDYRWVINGHDGVHVSDLGPLYFNMKITDDGNGNYAASNSSGANCGTIGTVSGTLKVNGSTVNFLSCKDSSGNALADTRVDGNWYNYYAAVAGAPIASSGADTPQDSICPKGWGLPKDGSLAATLDFSRLITTSYSLTEKNDTKLRAFPLSFVRSGAYDWHNAALNLRGSDGRYWSSGSYDTTNSWYLSFNGSDLNPRSRYSKGIGFAVRCVAIN